MPLKERRVRTKRHSRSYLRVYAPYLPLLLFLGLGIFAFFKTDQLPSSNKEVLSYSTAIQSDSLLKATNKERETAGSKPLEIDKKLQQAAQSKANDMVTENYWSHQSPDGTEPWDFIKRAGYSYSRAAENLAYGFGSGDSTVSGWMNSPAHRDNMLDGEFSEVGFGVAFSGDYQGKGDQTVVVAMYGNPAKRSIFGSENILPDEVKISYIQTLTGGNAPWSSFVAGILIGGIVMYFIVARIKQVRKFLRVSERFIIRHPLFDITLIVLLALIVIASRTAGIVH